MSFAADALKRSSGGRVLDIGCGAGRNAVPLARLGWSVIGTDLSWPMLSAAATRAREERVDDRFRGILAPMESLPVRDRSVDLVIAHGIWNLAHSGAQFRAALDEAARVARPGANLFVFTFSRHTLPAETRPVAGESFVFTQFSGEPQCFLTEQQLDAELARAGFVRSSAVPFHEYNLPAPGLLPTGKVPVIYEASFRRD
jgi:ubiquinone/menaquinone biosynthesis C-methylase UbiE